MNSANFELTGVGPGGVGAKSTASHAPTHKLWQIMARWDCWVFGVILFLVSGPVLFGARLGHLVFQPEAFRAGEWWRLFTHPFAHVSWYHLLLDGAAFLLLYLSLVERSWARRVAYVAAGAAGSLGSAWCVTGLPEGLCGLSGVAHGLMAVSAMEMIAGSTPGSAERRVGWISISLVMAKAAYELVTGRMFLEFLHFGLLGSPVAVSHAGGVIGALVAWSILKGCHQKPRMACKNGGSCSAASTGVTSAGGRRRRPSEPEA